MEFKLTYFRRYKNRYNKYAVLGKNENPATSDLDGLMWFKWVSSKGTIEIILSKAPDHNYVLAVYLYNELGRIRVNFQGTLFVSKVDNFSLGEGTEMRPDFIIPIGTGRGGIVIPANKLNSNKTVK